MSDSIGECYPDNKQKHIINPQDRVFVKAITTIRALSSRSNYGSLPRPPVETRIKLYGLYKQATEGNVVGIMARPTGSKLEDQGAKKKWDAWKNEQGLSKTEAKRKYIAYLIETMKVYASGTLEARELLSELEYLWDQIKDKSYTPSLSPESGSNTSLHNVQQQQYRNNLEQIYSHSRRNTSVFNGVPSVNSNEYLFANSIFSPNQPELSTASNPSMSMNNFQEIKDWQNEINSIINKLSSDFLTKHVVQPHQSTNFSSVLRDSTVSTNSNNNNNNNDGSNTLWTFIRPYLQKLIDFLTGMSTKIIKHISFNLIVSVVMLIIIRKRVKVVERRLANDEKQYSINLVLMGKENEHLKKLLGFVNTFLG